MLVTNNFTNKLKQPTDGFGLIEVVLIVIVAGVLSATGWYAFHSKAQTDKVISDANSVNKTATTPTTSGIFYSVAVPSDVKKQIQTFYNSFKPTCSLVKPGPVVFSVTKNVNSLQFQVSQTCGGVGGSHIYVDQNGNLIDAAVSAGTYACTDVDQYKISSKLVANCYVSNYDGSQTLRTNTNP